MAVIDLIADVAATDTALIAPESDFRLTYGALLRQARILAGALADAGVRRGDRIAVAMPNGPSLVVALLAASSLGTAVPLSVGDDQRAIDAAIDESRARAVVLPGDSPESGPTVKELGAVTDSFPGDDVAVVFQTRGTRGRPKRVPLSHANLSISATHVAARLGLGANDVSLCVMPICHVHGLVTATLATLATGGTVVIPAAFQPLAFWRVARDYGVTWYTAAPTLHQWLLARTADPGTRRPAGAARLRFIRSSGSFLPPAISQTLESAFGVPVVDAYEVTEAAGDAAAARVAILDKDGCPLETGQRGEIALAGPTVARSYEDDPAATREFFVDGWFRTGDFGYLDRGQLTLIRG
jgi:acyl-CoA synthetase (AMP-forming)/AMP-acid ligase II